MKIEGWSSQNIAITKRRCAETYITIDPNLVLDETNILAELWVLQNSTTPLDAHVRHAAANG